MLSPYTQAEARKIEVPDPQLVWQPLVGQWSLVKISLIVSPVVFVVMEKRKKLK